MCFLYSVYATVFGRNNKTDSVTKTININDVDIKKHFFFFIIKSHSLLNITTLKCIVKDSVILIISNLYKDLL